MRHVWHIATVVVMLGGTFASAADLPLPTGRHAVGRRVLRWVDESRREVLVQSPDEKRHVVVWLWYPAAPGPGSKTAPYVDELDRLRSGLSRSAVSLARSTRAHAIAGAISATEPDRFPVVLFSPGAGAIPAVYTTFAEELASHGYVVAAVDHPYDDMAVLLGDGRVIKPAKQPDGGEELLRYLRERVTVRAQDLQFAFVQLARIESGDLADALKGRLDLARAGAFGHSVGGMTAAEVCKNDQRFRACANMDGVTAAMPVYLEGSGGLVQPFLFIEKPFPAMRGEPPDQARRRIAVLTDRGNAALTAVTAGRSYRITISGATHESFSDEPMLGGGSAREREILRWVRTYLVAFFDETLKGRPVTTFDAAPPSTAVRVQTFSAKTP